MTSPTLRTYNEINEAYDFFNLKLFAGSLPPCLITMQRKNKTYGYFAGSRFGTRDGKEITDEIALNPSHFRKRTTEESLSTLVHEMAHLWQHHHGKPPRRGYHSREWAAKMRVLGLIPTDTGAPGGRETGQHVSHYIVTVVARSRH
jgi:predicted SprT family Zn-dependent metalloprotease